jgi:hypothetical protein
MNTDASQLLTRMEGFPAEDDTELAPLVEAVRRMPSWRQENVIITVLRAALGYERTGNEEMLRKLASGALVSFRSRRDAEDQKALDAEPPAPGPAEDAADLDEVFARLGLR